MNADDFSAEIRRQVIALEALECGDVVEFADRARTQVRKSDPRLTTDAEFGYGVNLFAVDANQTAVIVVRAETPLTPPDDVLYYVTGRDDE